MVALLLRQWLQVLSPFRGCTGKALSVEFLKEKHLFGEAEPKKLYLSVSQQSEIVFTSFFTETEAHRYNWRFAEKMLNWDAVNW